MRVSPPDVNRHVCACFVILLLVAAVFFAVSLASASVPAAGHAMRAFGNTKERAPKGQASRARRRPAP